MFFKMITIHPHQSSCLQSLDRAHIPRRFTNRAPDADILIPERNQRPLGGNFCQRLVVGENGHYEPPIKNVHKALYFDLLFRVGRKARKTSLPFPLNFPSKGNRNMSNTDNLDKNPDGTIKVYPLTGMTTAPIANTTIFMRLDFATSDKAIPDGDQNVQLVLSPAIALELSDRLKMLAQHILNQKPSGQTN